MTKYKHGGLTDKRCPKCLNPSSVKYVSNLCTSTPNPKYEFDCIEVGYYKCGVCDWRSEPETSHMYGPIVRDKEAKKP